MMRCNAFPNFAKYAVTPSPRSIAVRCVHWECVSVRAGDVGLHSQFLLLVIPEDDAVAGEQVGEGNGSFFHAVSISAPASLATQQ